MLRIPCPPCGTRDEPEFTFGGPSGQQVVLDIELLRRRTALRLQSWVSPDPQERTRRMNRQLLPRVVGQVSSGEPRALCVGPGEWLLVSDVIVRPEQRAHLEQQIEQQAVEQHLAVVELSEALAALRIRGPKCRDVLAKGCGVDFHPRSFAEDSCAQTLLAQVFVTLDCRGAQEFDVYVGRSYLSHLHSWIVDASSEYYASPD